MSAQEYDDWWAYYQVEPFGEERGDLRAGIIASTLANIHRDPKRRPEGYKPLDFMPYADRTSPAKALRERMRSVFKVRKK